MSFQGREVLLRGVLVPGAQWEGSDGVCLPEGEGEQRGGGGFEHRFLVHSIVGFDQWKKEKAEGGGVEGQVQQQGDGSSELTKG